MSTDCKYMAEQIVGLLIDKTIVGIVLPEDEESFGFIAVDLDSGKDDRTIVWVDQDAEGNGPGWLNIEPPK